MRLYEVYIGIRRNSELVTKFHVALHGSSAALLLLTSKFCPVLALPV
jgi:hypothetical protein